MKEEETEICKFSPRIREIHRETPVTCNKRDAFLKMIADLGLSGTPEEKNEELRTNFCDKGGDGCPVFDDLEENGTESSYHRWGEKLGGKACVDLFADENI